MIEVMEVDMVEVQFEGIWDEEEEKILSSMAIWGFASKGMSKLKKKNQ